MDLITTKMQLSDVPDILATRPKMAASLKAAGIDGDLPYIRKGIVPSDMEFNKKERSVIATISTLAVDRDGEVVLPEGMDNKHFQLNPVVTFGHNYGELPLGSAKWVNQYPDSDPVELRAKTIYPTAKANPFSEQVLQYQREGFPLAKSIGFIPVKSVTPDDKVWGDAVKSWRERRVESFEMKGIKVGDRPVEEDPHRIYTEWILLEYSDVPIPSNPEAVNIAVSKGLLDADSAKAYLPEIPRRSLMDIAHRQLQDYTIPEDDATVDKDSEDIEIVHTDVIDDTEEKEGRRFSAATLKALDDVRAAAEVSTQANQSVIKALNALFNISETDDIDEEDEETEAKTAAEVIELEPDQDLDITPEIAAILLEIDAQENTTDSQTLTAAEKLLVMQGEFV